MRFARKKMSLVKIAELTSEQIASICDHTFLATEDAFAAEAKEKGVSSVGTREETFYRFLDETARNPLKPYAVCVRPNDVRFAIARLPGDIKVASVVGFPNGNAYFTRHKIAEAREALSQGAQEIDMVMRYDSLIAGDLDSVRADIWEVLGVTRGRRVPLKVILETSELELDDIKIAAQMAEEMGVDFIKTSTGYSSAGANVVDVQIMRENFTRGIKISGKVDVGNVRDLLYAASGSRDEYIELDPKFVRIGESSLLGQLASGNAAPGIY